MTHLMALRTSVLCGLAAVAVAGCGTARLSSIASTAAPIGTAPGGVTTTTPATSSTASEAHGINQQISTIDSQLGAIDGQLNAASAGLNTSEGDPSQ